MNSFSKAQQKASEQALEFVKNPFAATRELLIWAVTGAGKTETVFAAISHLLEQKKSVLVATPRKDVVLELTPRLQAAFPEQRLISLHGESTQKGEIGCLVIATTHQAINFYRYFDLVILDEVDAFPYHNNPMLQRAVSLARKQTGQLIYLTATPPQHLLKQTRAGKAELIMIPSRHHGYPLVKPKIIIDTQLSNFIRKQQLPRSITDFLQHLLRTERQGFLFLPKVDWIEQMVEKIHTYILQKTSNHSWVVGTHARDPKRQQKIEAFRKGEVVLIVTTTILERGVTIPSTDCLVAWADAHIFDESALVQMAGRVGRSANDPRGVVLYVAESRSNAMVKAIKQIKKMNCMARERGFLREDRPNRESAFRLFMNRLLGRKE